MYNREAVKNIVGYINCYFAWNQFKIGIGVSRTNDIPGWKYILSIDLGFFSCWIYFGRN